jgi:hypothetical protein
MIFGLLLAEKQNVGQQIRTEQRAESFPEDDGRSKDADHNQQHREMTAINTVQNRKRTPINSAFLNIAPTVLSNLARSGKIYIRTMA